MSWSKSGDEITIKLTQDEYGTLLLALGASVGAMHGKDDKLFNAFLKLTNSINEGNPQYRPYEVREEPDAARG